MGTVKATILVCGAGILGLTIARELLRRGVDEIVVLEKEDDLGRHASGRNSGVLHAGIYYPKDTVKAQLCLKGNFLLRQYCKEKELPLLETGKVVVAKCESQLEGLHRLYDTALSNGAAVELIDENRLRELEPYARTYRQALYSHWTATVDPMTILRALASDLLASRKVQILTKTAFLGLRNTQTAVTSKGEITFSRFINAAGAYADRVAHAFGIGGQYRMIPFKGTYKKLRADRSFMVKGSIYPVPDLQNPFLGVHFTRSTEGTVYIGPTAIPAFGREHYGAMQGTGKESFRILYDDIVLLLYNSKFRVLAAAEPPKYLAQIFFQDAQSLVKGLQREDIENSSKVGIRPQLVDWKQKELVMDFVVLKGQSSLHILNAISPAFTSSMAFAEFVVGEHLDGIGS